MLRNQKKLALVATAMVLAVSANADQISVQEALGRLGGQRHLAASRDAQVSDFQLSYTATSGEKNCYYVVSDVANGGFMVLSADDCAPAVLAVVDNAEFNEAQMPPQFRDWLGYYRDLIANAIATGQTIRKVTPAGGTDIPIMLRTIWQQAAPYNNDCKDLLDAGFVSAEEQSLTGCVATAAAQCLYYYYDKFGYTPQPTGNVTYTIDYKNESGKGLKKDSLKIDKTFGDDDKIDWANMILMYDGFEYTDAQAAAIAKLMHMAGLSLKMQYEDKTGGSGTADDNIPVAFRDNWGFDSGVKYIMRDSTTQDPAGPAMSDQDWTDLIFGELKAARPVMYGAVARKSDGTNGGGHEFVIDGYRTSDDLFHVNWGWENGYCNCWCYLCGDSTKVLLPDPNGVNGSTGTADSSQSPYSRGQGAIIGIMPSGFSAGDVQNNGKHGVKIIKEDVDFAATEDMTVSGVKYGRKFNGNWQALYVPFDIPAASLQNFEVAEPESCTASAVTLKKVDSVSANGIYFIKANSADSLTIFVDAETTVTKATKATKEVNGFTFTGTSAGIKGGSWQKAWYAMGSGENAGKLIQTNVEPSTQADVEFLKPHRWYLAAASASGAAIRIVEEGETTGISEIAESAAAQQAYDLRGQRTDAGAKGIVVVNGKKVWNK